MNVTRIQNWSSKSLVITGLSLVMLSSGVLSGLGVQRLKTKVLVRALARDAKILSSHVGGALITIKDMETGKTLAQGVQKGGSGSTELIMKKPQERGAKIYDTEDAAFYLAELELDKPTLVEVTAEGPLAKPHAVQKASRTILLVPGKDVIGEGIILELHGFIVDLLRKDSEALLKPDQPLELEASVTML